MLGSVRRCPSCDSSSFERTPRIRATQCARCHTVLEERARSALPEYHAVSTSEELHCAVTPDLRGADDGGAPPAAIHGDPYATPGFISAFRLLAPMREPVYGATASTVSGALSEMERLLGDAVCCNARATPENRYAPVAYFEIVDMANILDVDRETSNLAVRLFSRTAASITVRNRLVEALAAASLCVALELRHAAHAAWLAARPDGGGEDAAEFDPDSIPPFPAPLASTTFADAVSASRDDVERNARLIRAAQAGETARPRDGAPRRAPPPARVAPAPAVGAAAAAAATDAALPAAGQDVPVMSRACAATFAKVTGFAADLNLDAEGTALAVSIVDKAFRLDACPRRAPASVSAAGIYLACQIMGVRLTQAEVCRVMQVTGVTLRKVYRELWVSVRAVVPEAYSVSLAKPPTGRRRHVAADPDDGAQAAPADGMGPNDEAMASSSPLSLTPDKREQTVVDDSAADADRPGTDEGDRVDDDGDNVDDDNVDDGDNVGDDDVDGDVDDDVDSDEGGNGSDGDDDEDADDAAAGVEGDGDADGDDGDEGRDSQRGEPVPSDAAALMQQQQQQLLSMMQQNPAAVAAFAQAMALMPSLAVPPPPPPPLPQRADANARRHVSLAPKAAAPLDASTMDQVRKMMETVSGQGGIGASATAPPPPPPPLPPRATGAQPPPSPVSSGSKCKRAGPK
jgi:transcription initiation factor TFIIIB Brf1 subunit/transcription initiation factor TFIIB